MAPDSFKGTFSAREVAAAVARGLRAAGREAEEEAVLLEHVPGDVEVEIDGQGQRPRGHDAADRYPADLESIERDGGRQQHRQGDCRNAPCDPAYPAVRR